MKATRLKKELGLWDVFALCTGAMFSSGFFLLPGLAAADAGPSVVLAYLLAGILVLPAMLSVAELATAMPKAGGAYYFLDRALGPAFGAIGGVGSWMALVLKSAFALIGHRRLPVLDRRPPHPRRRRGPRGAVRGGQRRRRQGNGQSPAPPRLASARHDRGLSWCSGSGRGPSAVPSPRSPRGTLAGGWEGVIATAGLVFVSYAGLTKVASVAEEVENADRNIPLGMGPLPGGRHGGLRRGCRDRGRPGADADAALRSHAHRDRRTGCVRPPRHRGRGRGRRRRPGRLRFDRERWVDVVLPVPTGHGAGPAGTVLVGEHRRVRHPVPEHRRDGGGDGRHHPGLGRVRPGQGRERVSAGLVRLSPHRRHRDARESDPVLPTWIPIAALPVGPDHRRDHPHRSHRPDGLVRGGRDTGRRPAVSRLVRRLRLGARGPHGRDPPRVRPAGAVAPTVA